MKGSIMRNELVDTFVSETKKNAGKIEVYTHSDSTTPNKGGCLVRVLCQTEFAAKTDEFGGFCKKVAKMMYGFDKVEWKDLVAEYPEIEQERLNLEGTLKEKVWVDKAVILFLSEPSIPRESEGKLAELIQTNKIKRFIPPLC
jgi:translation elongation factor EF-Ts